MQEKYPHERVEKHCTPEFMYELWGRYAVQHVEYLPMFGVAMFESSRYRHGSLGSSPPRLESLPIQCLISA